MQTLTRSRCCLIIIKLIKSLLPSTLSSWNYKSLSLSTFRLCPPSAFALLGLSLYSFLAATHFLAVTCLFLHYYISVQNPGKWLTWNICTGGMGYARDAGMYWVLSINMNYLHWGVWGIKQIQSTWNICTDGLGSTGYAGNAGMYWVLSIDPSTLTPKHHYHCLTLGPYPQNTKLISSIGTGADRYARRPRWAHSILNTQYCTFGP